MIGLMEQHKGYRELEDNRGRRYTTFEQFCTTRQPWGLGYNKADIDRIIAERRDAQAMAQGAEPLFEHGANQHNRETGCEIGHYKVISLQGNSTRAVYVWPANGVA
jgi:hypothetical protein